MARKNKTASSLKKQAKKQRSAARKSIAAAKRGAKPTKAAARQTKQATKKFKRQVVRAKVKASTRKLPSLIIRKGKRKIPTRRVPLRGNLFAPLQKITKRRQKQIQKRIYRFEEGPVKRPKKSDIIKEKEAQRAGLEYQINKRNRWLREIDEDDEMPDKQKKSARRNIRAEIDTLIKSMERVERAIFKLYANRSKRPNTGTKARTGKEKTARKRPRR